jgi:hypothetical protein
LERFAPDYPIGTTIPRILRVQEDCTPMESLRELLDDLSANAKARYRFGAREILTRIV